MFLHLDPKFEFIPTWLTRFQQLLVVSGLLMGSLQPVLAQNPIVPPGIYIADPSAHVWKDGKLYVYGSTDENPSVYCSKRYEVLSSTDLKAWQRSGQSFASQGAHDQVPYNDALLWAPDVQYRNGKYYLYYCQFDPKNTEGVAESTSPTGPFTKSTPLYTKGINQIDPCVFIDDDGQAYYIWGQLNAKVAKLKPNMREIDTTTIRENVVTQQAHHFHEGAYMLKRKGLYYLIYADVSRANRPTCLGYSTSRSPFGPFTYQGVIVDNDHSDPVVWNNHGSLVEFKGQWYVFYHRSTHGSVSMRKTCLEPIRFRPDGTIPEVEMTSQGAAGPLDAFAELDAARACLLLGNVRIQATAADNEVLGELRSGDKAGFKYLNFGAGADSVSFRVAPGSKPCRINLFVNDIWSTPIGSVDVPAKKAEKWVTVKAAVHVPAGTHALWLSFTDPAATGMFDLPLPNTRPGTEELFQVDALRFYAKKAGTSGKSR
ncbi:MAG TPA: family 43 glycosylhydrolase [Hymenobacter sp.]|jgi:hypothetical protein